MASTLRRALTYARQIGRGLVRHSVDHRDLVRSLPEWWASVDGPGSPLEDRRPWMTFGGIRALEAVVEPGSTVFEYGAGGSTLFFLDRGARVVSVEHDPSWADRTRAIAGERPDWELHVCPPEPVAAASEEFRSHSLDGSFEKYVRAIDDCERFDVVVVDGRSRIGCLRRAPSHVKPGGLVVLDNAERPIYGEGARALDRLGWQRDDYFGPGPYNAYFWQTTIWVAGA